MPNGESTSHWKELVIRSTHLFVTVFAYLDYLYWI